MSSPDDLRRWDRDHLWHPFTPMQEYAAGTPLIIARGDGPWLEDIHGRRYLDAVSSLWCNLHGHRVAAIDEAIRQQLDQIAHSTLLGIANVPAIELARRLVEVAPPGLTRVFFSDSGATAVEIALKMAFQSWRQRPTPEPQRTLYLSVGGAYHGDTIGAVSLGDIGRFHDLFKPLLFDCERTPAPYCYRCPLGLEHSTCGLACLTEAEALIRRHADRLAAVVVEPLVQGAAGMVMAPDGYLRRLREVTRECGVLLIADEVATGFGRTGTLFACEQEGVRPDFLCVAKGITGGYLPLAATLTTEAIYGTFLGPADAGRTFFHGHTYCGNPLGCAAALASLELLLEGGVLAQVPAKAALLGQHLEHLRPLPNVGEIRQRGLMVGVELVRDRATRAPFAPSERMGQRICLAARERGVLMRPLRDVLVLMPPLNLADELIGEMVDVVAAAIAEVTGTSTPSRATNRGSWGSRQVRLRPGGHET